MKCVKCDSENVKIDFVQEKIKTNDVSFIHRIIRLCLIICTCGLWFFVPKKRANSKVKNIKMAICQDCGHSWKV